MKNKLTRYMFTCCGMMSVVIWASNVYLLKKTLDIYGYVSGIGLIYLFSGLFGIICYLFKNNIFEKIKCNDFSDFTEINKISAIIYTCLIANNIFSSLSFGTAPENEVLLQIIIISDTWTLLINILLVQILHYTIQNKIVFFAGMFMGFIGIIIACIGFDFSKINFTTYFAKYWYSYFFAIMSAIVWSYYSVYIKKYETLIKDDHLIFSMLISGLIMILISFTNPSFNNYDNITLNFKTIGFMMYEVLVACSLAYYFWSLGFKYGSAKAVSNFSILAPMLNVCFTSVFYGLNMMYNIIFGAILLIIAMLCCKHSIKTQQSTIPSLLDKLIEERGSIDNL